MKPPKNDAKFLWTNNAFRKMQFYCISESRVKRIIRFPMRVEEGIAVNTVAVMQPAGTKRYQEIWVMYKLTGKKIKVITAWRYPGKSPERNPIPENILQEVRNLL